MKQGFSVIGLGLLLGLLLAPQPAFALFVNGGFESGDFTGWTFDYGLRSYSSTNITWGQPNNGRSRVINAATPMQMEQTLPVPIYNGTYMARINDDDWRYHATKISQTGVLQAADIYPGAALYVNWGAMLPNPAGHDATEQPYFKIAVTVGGNTTWFDAYGNQTAGWTPAGTNYDDPLFYKKGTFMFDLSSLTPDTAITIEMIASDCSLGGHGGWAYLDGIGTTYQPPAGVPEPATLLLLGCALGGLYGIRRKMS